jgi:hypothetical protein
VLAALQLFFLLLSCYFQLPIPVWNAVDDDDRILLPMAPAEGAAAAADGAGADAAMEEVPEFEYTRDYK